jgi:hypothetical protein
MQPVNQASNVITDNNAPKSSKRESKLKEAFSLLAQLNEEQLRFMFEDFNITL